MKNKAELYKIWENVNHLHGWLRLLEMSGDYHPEEIKMLEKIDENALEYEKETEKFYYSTKLARTRKAIEEFKEEFSKRFRKERRLEYLNNCLENLNKSIAQDYEDYFKMFKRDMPAWFRKGSLEWRKTYGKERRRKRIQMEIYYLTTEKEVKGRITPQEIARALEFPFENLIELRKGFALCPFHKEKHPSFFVKNNWGYCFSCHWHGDTIKFLMDKDGLSFPEAVKRLS